MLYIYYGESLTPANIGYNTLAEAYTSVPRIKERLGIDENLHISMNHCDGSAQRNWTGTDLFWFDIDKVDPEKWREVLATISLVTQIPKEQFWVNCSGNGLHFITHIEPLNKELEFEILQNIYKKFLRSLREELEHQNIPCIVDMVMKATQTLRLPQTINNKEGVKTDAYILQRSNGHATDILALKDKNPELSGLSPAINVRNGSSDNLPEVITESNTFNSPNLTTQESDSQYYTEWFGGVPDVEKIMSSCDFLKFCKDSPSAVREPEWYAMLSIVSRFPNGREDAHALSSPHESYSYEETDRKISQALRMAGPRTCASINDVWGKCKACPNFNKVKSPISLRSELHIATADQGFHTQKMTRDGIKHVPDVESMVNYIIKTKSAKVLRQSEDVIAYNDGVYEFLSERDIKSIARLNFKPEVTSQITQEVFTRMQENPYITFQNSPNNYPLLLNMQNGILNMETKQLLPHSPNYIFTTKSPITFDPSAKCPHFEEWLRKILFNDQDKIDTVLDYMAYAISGTDLSNEKFLMLTGSGANGKSILVKIMRMILGDYMKFSKANSFMNFGKDVVLGSRCIAFEELPSGTDKNFWEEIKDMSSGGVARINRKFLKEIEATCFAKFIFICNQLPYGTDSSDGFFRRFLIVKFEMTFKDEEIIPNYEREFVDELPGILNLLVDRLPRLIPTRFKIIAKGSVQNEINQYREDKDMYLRYFNMFQKYEEVQVRPAIAQKRLDGAGYRADVFKIFKHFCEWCEAEMIKPNNRQLFMRKLKQKYPENIAYCKTQKRYFLETWCPPVTD